jgi:DNA polymerase-3 subunit gamma/tau
MSYQVLARKWRPQNFAEMVGQEHVLKSLSNALEANRLHHAYMFSGTRGVGKTTIARILAKCLNCEQGVTATPCGVCKSCVEIAEGRFVDLIEIDAASRTKVEDTREILDNVQYAPTCGRFKVYLIDEVHMLSAHSFNALLKTLEEPPEHVKFLLATSDPQKLPVTVLSRCLQFNLKNLSVELLTSHLEYVLQQEEVSFDDQALILIARAACGSVRDSLSLLDQAIAFSNSDITAEKVQEMLGMVASDHIYNLLIAILANDASTLLQEVSLLSEKSVDYADILANISRLLFHISLRQAVPENKSDEFDNAKINDLSAAASPEVIQVLYQISIIGRRDLPLAPDAKIGFEMALLRMLSFRPLDVSTQQATSKPSSVNASLSSSASTPTSLRQKLATKPLQKPQEPMRSSFTPQEIPSAKQMISSPGHKETISAPLVNKTPTGSESWQDIIKEISLPGMAKQFALNTSLLEKNGSNIKLLISDNHTSLASESLKKRLCDSLSDYYNEKIKLEVVTSEIKVETPAVANEREIANRQKSAEDSIINDSNVQFLQAEFNAIIVPDSIKPI